MEQTAGDQVPDLALRVPVAKSQGRVQWITHIFPNVSPDFSPDPLLLFLHEMSFSEHSPWHLTHSNELPWFSG